ncbi:MAG: NADH:flavin oxidoreductase [Candidatus Aminicenantales bacterium]
MKSVLFTPFRIGQLKVENRFVRCATHDFMASKEGFITERQVSLFKKLAQGEVGLIITGHAYIHPSGKASPFQIAVDSDAFVEGLKKITDAVHNYPSRILLQLSHAGRQTRPSLCSCTPLAPSPVYEPNFKVKPKEMSEDEIEEVIEAFIKAAGRAREAGFDGVELHAAHGYLLSSFISPFTNRRKDRWGGSIVNRSRIIIEILRGIKKQQGKNFPVIIKLNSSDFFPGGLEIEESLKIAKILDEEGIDGIEVSGGMAEAGKGSVWKGVRSEEEEGYFVENASRIKSSLTVPVFGLGGLRTFSVMDGLVRKGKVDFISMSRPFIREPFLVKKFRTQEIDKSDCISCNRCFNLRGIRCANLEKKNSSED